MKKEHFGSVTWTRREAMGKGYIADRNLYLDADDNLVEEDSPAQVRQLVGKGGMISEEAAKRYGLLKKEKTEQSEEVDGGEKASSPSQNKAEKPGKNKGAK